MTKFAPIVLFVFTRPKHTLLTLETLAANRLAEKSELFIYSDGPRNYSEANRIYAVRRLAHRTKGFRRCTVIERNTNYGLSRNIIDGVTEICDRYGRVIVLEDDMVTSPFFLDYMNEALQRYETDSRIASIHGYVYPLKQPLPQPFFLRGADCWGWATWHRAWKRFNPDSHYLLKQLKLRKLISEFDLKGAYPFSKQLTAQCLGKIDSWAIRWHASVFLEGMLTLYPGCSLVQNTGIDGSGMNCKASDWYKTALCRTSPNLDCLDVQASEEARAAFESFFRHTNGTWITRIVLLCKKLYSGLIYKKVCM